MKNLETFTQHENYKLGKLEAKLRHSKNNVANYKELLAIIESAKTDIVNALSLIDLKKFNNGYDISDTIYWGICNAIWQTGKKRSHRVFADYFNPTSEGKSYLPAKPLSAFYQHEITVDKLIESWSFRLGYIDELLQILRTELNAATLVFNHHKNSFYGSTSPTEEYLNNLEKLRKQII